MLNMFLAAFGWADGIEPATCCGLESIVEIIKNRCWTDGSGDIGGRADIDRISVIYQNTEPLSYDLRINEYSASGLNSLLFEREAAESAGSRELPGLDPRLEELLSEKGLEADFGTLCHRLIEYRIKGITGDMPALLRSVFGKVSDDIWPLVFFEATALADRFFDSELWKSASAAGAFESELSFTAVREHEGSEVFVKGVIDLLFETAETVHVVDFKTDRRITPGEYDMQMQVYMDAASAIYEKPADCSLFYLRGGLEVKVRIC
jgi:hypothetical protein